MFPVLGGRSLSVILEDDREKGFFCRDKAMEHTYYIICAVHHQWALKPKNKVEDASHRLLYVYFKIVVQDFK